MFQRRAFLFCPFISFSLNKGGLGSRTDSRAIIIGDLHLTPVTKVISSFIIHHVFDIYYSPLISYKMYSHRLSNQGACTLKGSREGPGYAVCT